MKIIKSKQFLKDLSKLSNFSTKVEKALSFFEDNVNHPSLHNKHIVLEWMIIIELCTLRWNPILL